VFLDIDNSFVAQAFASLLGSTLLLRSSTWFCLACQVVKLPHMSEQIKGNVKTTRHRTVHSLRTNVRLSPLEHSEGINHQQAGDRTATVW
jgi:hypothetical protein